MELQEKPVLTTILAVKDPREIQYQACLCSIASLKNANKICLTVVSSGVLPEIQKSIYDCFYRTNIINQPPDGVYSAYNRGLREPLADYVLVLGVDDIVLPGLDDLIDKIATLNSPDLIAACSFMQHIGISRPSRFKSGLIFRNWCQQGLLYNSRVFISKNFDVRYKMQADHKFNMELITNDKIIVSYQPDIITYFSYGGISSTINDWEFRSDMPRIVKSCYGNFWYYIALFKRLVATKLKGYPEYRGTK